MPREQSIKQLLAETVIFISMFALAGHLGLNFFDKYVIQSELSHMKGSLHSMKKTITKIGNAYDNLHYELKGLKQKPENRPKSKEPGHRHRTTYMANRKPRNDAQVNTAIAENNDKSCSTHYSKESAIDSSKRKHVLLYNATTITRRPLKSSEAGPDAESAAEEESCRYITCDSKLGNCYKECNECRNRNNWKF